MFKDFRYIILLIWTALKIVSVFTSHLWLQSLGIERSIGRIAFVQTGNWLLGGVFLYLIIPYVQRLIDNKSAPVRHISLHLLNGVIFTLLLFIIPIGVECYLNVPHVTLAVIWDLFKGNSVNFFKESFLTYNFLIGVFYALYVRDRKRHQETELEKVHKQLLETRLLYLKSQLHPHFLFNALHAISTLMESEVKKAQNMLVDLSDLLRVVLEFDERKKIKLSEELHVLDKYISIETTRFSDSLKIEKNVDDSLMSVLVPPFLLQPLVENSIRHGQRNQFTKISISIIRKGDFLEVIVSDNGFGFDQEIEMGTGMKNTKDRLDTLYGERASFKNFNDQDGGAINQVTIPIEYESDHS